MDAVEFLEKLTRMCKMYTKEEPFESCNPCEKTCPLYELEFNSMNKDESNTGIFYLMKNESDTFVNIVERWSIEHPRKTRLDDFKEKYPKAKTFESGTPKVCASSLGYCEYCVIGNDCSRDCDACWNEPVE